MNKLLTKIVGAALGAAMAIGVGVAVANSSKSVEPAKATTGDWSWSGTAAPNGFKTGENQSNTISGLAFTTTVTYSDSGWALSSNNGKTTATFTTTAFAYHVDSIEIDWATNSKKKVTWNAKVGDSTVQSTQVGNTSGTDSGTLKFDGWSDDDGTVTFYTTSPTGGYKITGLRINAKPSGDPEKTLSSIAVSGSMSKTSYVTDESWDPTGLVVTATYSDSSTAPVTSNATWTYSPENPNATNIESVIATASYTEGGVTKQASSSAQSVTITDKGTSANPYTVSEAWTICNALSNGANNGKAVHVTGIVSGSVSVTTGRGTFDITDGSKTLKAYSITGVNNSDNTDPTYVADGYTVVIVGAIIKYNANTYEVGYASGFTTSLVSSVAPKTVSSISVKTAPSKIAYKSGETFVATGLVITATYSDSSTEDIPYAGNEASFTFSPATITEAGNVTITYRGQTCNQAVTLITVTNVTGVASAPTEVYQNGSIAGSSVTLNVVYSDSSVGTVKADSVVCDTSTLGTATATATYNAATGTKTATFDIEVVKVPVWTYISDVLTNSDFDATSTSYVTTTGVAKISDARYTANTAKPGATQFRIRGIANGSGIVSTVSGGFINQISAVNVQSSRTIHVFGSNSAYTEIADLNDDNKKGTEIGTITSSSLTLNVTGDYEYVGLYSSDATTIDSLTFKWKVEDAEYPLTANPVLSTGASASVVVGKSLALSITTTPANSDEKLIVTSSDTTKVTVTGSNKNYVIHGLAVTSSPVTITVTGMKGTYSSSTSISVIEAVKTYEDKVITPSAINVTGDSYAINDAADHECDGVAFATHDTQMNSGSFQMKKSSGYIQNSEVFYRENAVDAKIKSITVFLNEGNEGTITVYEGTSAGPSEELEATKTSGNVSTYVFNSNKTYFKIMETGGSHPAKIDKFVIELNDDANSVLSEARSAATVILNNLKNTCGDGKSGIVAQEQWNTMSSALAALNLSADAKLLLKNATRLALDDLTQGGAEIENAMAHYDACVTKFGFTPDSSITSVQPSIRIIPNSFGNNANGLIAIVVATSMVSALSFVAFFLLRKRKER